MMATEVLKESVILCLCDIESPRSFLSATAV